MRKGSVSAARSSNLGHRQRRYKEITALVGKAANGDHTHGYGRSKSERTTHRVGCAKRRLVQKRCELMVGRQRECSSAEIRAIQIGEIEINGRILAAGVG